LPEVQSTLLDPLKNSYQQVFSQYKN